jgi:hypothetical protein
LVEVVAVAVMEAEVDLFRRPAELISTPSRELLPLRIHVVAESYEACFNTINVCALPVIFGLLHRQSGG